MCAQGFPHPEEPPLPEGEPLDPAALSERIRWGDRAAEAELVARFRAPLLTMLRRRVKDAALAEDLCQEVFTIALPALREGRLRKSERLAAYLWGIARFTAQRALKRRARERQTVEAAGDLVDRGSAPGDSLLRQERSDRLQIALGALADRDRRVLAAFYLSESSKADICRQLALTSSQFDVIKHRAIRRLATAWREAPA